MEKTSLFSWYYFSCCFKSVYRNRTNRRRLYEIFRCISQSGKRLKSQLRLAKKIDRQTLIWNMLLNDESSCLIRRYYYVNKWQRSLKGFFYLQNVLLKCLSSIFPIFIPRSACGLSVYFKESHKKRVQRKTCNELYYKKHASLLIEGFLCLSKYYQL